MTWQDRYLQRFYAGRPGWTDGTTYFHGICREFAPQRARILDVGAGPSNRSSRFFATLGELHGVDVDPAVLDNDALAGAAVIDTESYPFEAESFDLVVSSYVVEHVSDPLAQLAEIRRVLKPDGRYVFRTPNFYHYVALVSAFTPLWFHRLVANRLRNAPADNPLPYETFYRLNTASAVRDGARRVGFDVERLELIEKEPSYTLASRVFFFAGLAYERAVNATDALEQLRSNLFVVLRKTTHARA